MVRNFPNDEISWFINMITNIRNHSGPSLETCRSILQNGKQYSAENLYLNGIRNSYRGIEPLKLIALSVRTSANSPGSDRCEPWKASVWDQAKVMASFYHCQRINHVDPSINCVKMLNMVDEIKWYRFNENLRIRYDKLSTQIPELLRHNLYWRIAWGCIKIRLLIEQTTQRQFILWRYTMKHEWGCAHDGAHPTQIQRWQKAMPGLI